MSAPGESCRQTRRFGRAGLSQTSPAKSTKSNVCFRASAGLAVMTEMRARCRPAVLAKSSLAARGPSPVCRVLGPKMNEAAVRLSQRPVSSRQQTGRSPACFCSPIAAGHSRCDLWLLRGRFLDRRLSENRLYEAVVACPAMVQPRPSRTDIERFAFEVSERCVRPRLWTLCRAA